MNIKNRAFTIGESEIIAAANSKIAALEAIIEAQQHEIDELRYVLGEPKPVCRCGHLVQHHADKNGGSHKCNIQKTGFCGCVFSKEEAMLHQKDRTGL